MSRMPWHPGSLAIRAHRSDQLPRRGRIGVPTRRNSRRTVPASAPKTPPTVASESPATYNRPALLNILATHLPRVGAAGDCPPIQNVPPPCGSALRTRRRRRQASVPPDTRSQPVHLRRLQASLSLSTWLRRRVRILSRFFKRARSGPSQDLNRSGHVRQAQPRRGRIGTLARRKRFATVVASTPNRRPTAASDSPSP